MSDEKKIEKVLQAYLDCMLESSAERAHAAFHPNAKITGYIGEDLRQLSVSDYANRVESERPSPKENGATPLFEVLSIEIAGATAVARVRDEFAGMIFLDTLSLLKDGDKWSIYNKLFHVEGPSGQD